MAITNIFATEYGFEGDCPLVCMVNVVVRRGVNAVTVEGPMTLHSLIAAAAIFSDPSSLQPEEYPMTTLATTYLTSKLHRTLLSSYILTLNNTPRLETM